MKKWLDKMERKFGRYAVRNLTLYLIVCYIVGFVLSQTMPALLSYFTLEIGLVLKGQVWRLISWVIIPPQTNIIFVIFMLLLYYSLGTTLERTWGAFRYNVYIFSGMIFTIIGAVLVYLLTGGVIGLGGLFSTYYINLSIFLACAALMPDLQLYFWGFIPIKMKWLAYLDVALLLIDMVNGNLIIRIIIIASLLNFIIFFLFNRNMQPYRPKEIARKKQFHREIQRPVNRYEGGARHKCAVCGRTELDDPNLEFRYCSKCNGNYEYCQDHLFTHTHVK
ncbi:hypothetical protein ABXS75_11120 [Roseburia hominis]